MDDFGGEKLTAVEDSPDVQNRLLYMVSSFIMDLGPKGIFGVVRGKVPKEVLYREFCEDHPRVKIRFDEFERHVVESLKRISSATVAEVAAVPGSAFGSGLVCALKAPSYLVGKSTFVFSMLANFAGFASVWAVSHKDQFVDSESGRFQYIDFAKSVCKEYRKHFGGIAIVADLVEAYLIQLLADKDFNYVLSAGFVTAVGSTLAVLVYFYEQNLRVNFAKTSVGKTVFDISNAFQVAVSKVAWPG